MFKWDESISRLDMPAENALRLMRSMRDVQMALPGLPSQEASAYLCQYRSGDLVATVAVFHLQRSSQLAFYRSEPPEVVAGKADGMFEQGLDFVESMGFLLSDMDIDQMTAADRTMLWESLPLRTGVEAGKNRESAAPTAAAEKEQAETAGRVATQADTIKAVGVITAATGGMKSPTLSEETYPTRDRRADSDKDGDADVDQLLAAVQSLRAPRAVAPPVKKQPTPDEIRKRRLIFKENIGRILASL